MHIFSVISLFSLMIKLWKVNWKIPIDANVYKIETQMSLQGISSKTLKTTKVLDKANKIYFERNTL